MPRNIRGGGIYFTFRGDNAQFQKTARENLRAWDQMNRRQRAFAAVSRRTNKAVGALVSRLAAFASVAAIGVGIGRANAAMAEMTRQSTALGASIIESSRAAGISVENYQALQRVFEGDGVAAERFSGIITNLQRRLLESGFLASEQRTFDILGIDIKQLRADGATTEDIIFAISDALAGIEDTATRAAVVIRLFGGDAAGLAPTLAQGSAALRANAEAMSQFGINTEDQLQSLKDFQQGLTDIANAQKTLDAALVAENAEELLELERAIAEARGELRRLFGPTIRRVLLFFTRSLVGWGIIFRDVAEFASPLVEAIVGVGDEAEETTRQVDNLAVSLRKAGEQYQSFRQAEGQAIVRDREQRLRDFADANKSLDDLLTEPQTILSRLNQQRAQQITTFSDTIQREIEAEERLAQARSRAVSSISFDAEIAAFEAREEHTQRLLMDEDALAEARRNHALAQEAYLESEQQLRDAIRTGGYTQDLERQHVALENQVTSSRDLVMERERTLALTQQEGEAVERLAEHRRNQVLIQEQFNRTQERNQIILGQIEQGALDVGTALIVPWQDAGDQAEVFFKRLFELLLQELVLTQAIAAARSAILGSSGGGEGAAGGGIDFAQHGGVHSGFTIVGEAGPELVDFRTPSRVYTNEELGGALGGGRGDIVFSPIINSADGPAVRKAIGDSFQAFSNIVRGQVIQDLRRNSPIRSASR